MKRPSTKGDRQDDRRLTIKGKPQLVELIPVRDPLRYYRVEPAGQILPPGHYRAILNHARATARIERDDA